MDGEAARCEDRNPVYLAFTKLLKVQVSLRHLLTTIEIHRLYLLKYIKLSYNKSTACKFPGSSHHAASPGSITKTSIACQAHFVRFFALRRKIVSCEVLFPLVSATLPSTRHFGEHFFPSTACTFLKKTRQILRYAKFVYLILFA